VDSSIEREALRWIIVNEANKSKNGRLNEVTATQPILRQFQVKEARM
jgi:hypothetical protein